MGAGIGWGSENMSVVWHRVSSCLWINRKQKRASCWLKWSIVHATNTLQIQEYKQTITNSIAHLYAEHTHDLKMYSILMS